MSLIQRLFCGTLITLAAFQASQGYAAVILQLRVIEGEGSVYAAGSRATRGISVQVTDETGQPVDGATVSFRLPDQGPSGTFQAGLRSEVAITHADGRASIWGMQWNNTAGPFELRIAAAKDQIRAGVVSTQYLSAGAVAQNGGSGKFQASHSHKKWLILAVAVAAGAASGVALGRAQSKAATAPPTVVTTIGSPTINIGPK